MKSVFPAAVVEIVFMEVDCGVVARHMSPAGLFAAPTGAAHRPRRQVTQKPMQAMRSVGISALKSHHAKHSASPGWIGAAPSRTPWRIAGSSSRPLKKQQYGFSCGPGCAVDAAPNVSFLSVPRLAGTSAEPESATPQLRCMAV